MSSDELYLNEDEHYAYVIITAYGMGNEGYYADKCEVCGERIKCTDDEWRHVEDESNQCEVTVTLGYNKTEQDWVEVSPRAIKRHSVVFETIPDSVQQALTKTDDTEFGIHDDDPDDVETKWVGWLNKDQWYDLRNDWSIDPDRSENTMGMLTEYGHMWAFCDFSDGMDWNMGGVTPVSYVDIYYCSLDPDVLDRVHVTQ